MDSETKKRMSHFIKAITSENSCDISIEAEVFIDWVYDTAYRKGWDNGYWRIDPDYCYQVSNLRRKKNKS